MYLRFIFIVNMETPVQNVNFFRAAPSSVLSYRAVLEAPSIYYPLSLLRQGVLAPIELFLTATGFSIFIFICPDVTELLIPTERKHALS